MQRFARKSQKVASLAWHSEKDGDASHPPSPRPPSNAHCLGRSYFNLISRSNCPQVQSMRPQTASTFAATARWSIQPAAATPASAYGRAASYRRISTLPRTSQVSSTRTSLPSTSTPSSQRFLRSEFLPQDVLFRTSSAYARHFSSRPALYEQAQKQKDVKDQEPDPTKSTASQGSTSEQAAGDQAKKEGEEAKEKKDGEEEAGEQKEGEEGQKKEKKDAPPPPPHGDKTPWQVFTETLKQEFQASKDWNEGTKQLGGALHDFQQNPNVQKAGQISEAAKTKTTEALKATASAVGHGAAWTWDTMPVKGVRAAARVTGTGLEYATRPVRQTKAFQAVKETIDDGSSSRYGGWVEKEERRKRRELRELNELQRTGGKPLGPMEEDPK